MVKKKRYLTMVRHPKTSFSIWTVDLLLCLPSSFACERLKTSMEVWFQNTLSKSKSVGRKLNSPEIIKKKPKPKAIWLASRVATGTSYNVQGKSILLLNSFAAWIEIAIFDLSKKKQYVR